MRFIFNDIPDDENFEPNEEWTPLKEASNLWIIQLQAIPFLIINGLLIYLLFKLFGISYIFDSTTILISVLVLIPIHEFIHALFFPEDLIKSKNIYFGFMLKGLAPFVGYNGEMTRNTFIKTLLAPFVIITIVGFLLLIKKSNPFIESIILFNALGASADCLGVFKLLRQVPKNAVVRNKKIKTYWKIDNSTNNKELQE